MPAPPNRNLPAAPILALLRRSHPNAADPPGLANAAKRLLDRELNAQSLLDLNEGQYAALIHRVIDMGIGPFKASELFRLINDGNHTLSVFEFENYGDLGGLEKGAWLMGNSQ